MNGRFTPDPGEVDTYAFDVCGDNMDVKRNVHGPTGFAEGMSGKGHLHDAFNCPSREEMRHLQAFKLQEEAEKTASKRIEDLLLTEMREVVEKRQATKEVSKF